MSTNRREYMRVYMAERRAGRKAAPDGAAEFRAEMNAIHTKFLIKRGPVYTLLRSAKMRAKRDGVPFELTENDVKIPTHCPVLGILLSKGAGKSGPNSPSLDRIVPSLGYVKGNVAVMSHRANTIKNDATADDHIRIAIWIKHNTPATASVGEIS